MAATRPSDAAVFHAIVAAERLDHRRERVAVDAGQGRRQARDQLRQVGARLERRVRLAEADAARQQQAAEQAADDDEGRRESRSVLA